MEINYKSVSITLSLTALGLIIGSIASFIKLPIYLDTIGIMLTTLLLGWRYGILCSLITAAFSFVFISAFVPFYIGTMLGTVATTEILHKFNYYSTVGKSIFSGIVHGVVGTALSLPVTYLLFGGFTSSGNDIIVAYLNSNGMSLLLSLLISLTTFAIVDRILTCIFCHSILKTIPKTFINQNGLRYYKK